jgi:hypothetical protein
MAPWRASGTPVCSVTHCNPGLEVGVAGIGLVAVGLRLQAREGRKIALLDAAIDQVGPDLVELQQEQPHVKSVS